MRKWIVKVKKTVRRRKWEQRIKEQTGKDPMVCPHCQCYYEYKGEVCLKDGQLEIKHAKCETSRACLERMINHFTGIKKTQTKPKEAAAKRGKEPVKEYSQLHLFAV